MLIKRLFEPNLIFLVDYGNMIPELQRIASSIAHDRKPQQIFICDLALSKKNEKDFVEIIRKFASEGIKVTYIDHHDLGKDIESELIDIGVQLVHSIDECTSVQIYDLYKEQLEGDSYAAFYAAAAALTDFMDDRPLASSLVRRFDKLFLMLQSAALSYIISAKQHDDAYLLSLVSELSKDKFTHEIQDGFVIASEYAGMVGDAVKQINSGMSKLDNLAYASGSSSLSTSMIVNFVLGASGKPVAVVYKKREDMPGSCQISVRGTNESKVHLGRIVNGIATELGGNGGGHEKACGAIIPDDKITEFLQMLDRKIV